MALGSVGEVVVRGSRVMREYWNNPAATAEAIVDGWYHTGDMGYLDAERTLYIVDRKKDMIITGAENVYSVEVENALASHPDVLEAAVIGLPNEQWGEAVVGIVCARAGSNVGEAELIAYCREQIAGYKVPKRVDVAFEPLPKTSTGKLAKAVLRSRYVAPKAMPV
jgi:long-chain acyl-CoA synthetase